MRLLSSILQPWQPPGGILSAEVFTTYWHPSLQIFYHNNCWQSLIKRESQIQSQTQIPNHIVCRGLYNPLASKSTDLLPQLLLTINRKSQIILSTEVFTTYWHPSLQIFCHTYFWPSTENPKSNPKSYCHQIFLPPRMSGRAFCSTLGLSTATKAQSILTGRSLIVLHIIHIIVVTCCQCCHLLSMLSPTCNWTFKRFYLEGGQFAFLWT